MEVSLSLGKLENDRWAVWTVPRDSGRAFDTWAGESVKCCDSGHTTIASAVSCATPDAWAAFRRMSGESGM